MAGASPIDQRVIILHLLPSRSDQSDWVATELVWWLSAGRCDDPKVFRKEYVEREDLGGFFHDAVVTFTTMSGTIFINYRREDSSPVARGLRENLVQAFGPVVFMDIDEIRVGDTWPQSLTDALQAASALLVVIGPTWLRIADAHGRRRIDGMADWVRTEIETCLAAGVAVIPILIGRATMPSREALPESIADLTNKQYIELRETHWKQDLAPLIERLSMPPLSFKREGEKVPVPEWRGLQPPDAFPRALGDQEIQERLGDIPNWKVVVSPLPGEYPKTRTELYRALRFSSFDAALAFMQSAAPFINKTNHHPRWENVFKTVSVWLSTWDTGHMLSALDFNLARQLDERFEEQKKQKV